MNAFPDYYTLLGVERNATAAEIKAAFKKLALQYHPDVYKGADAPERMRLLLLAYQTLSDNESRREYDAKRAEHVLDGSSPRVQASRNSPSSPRGRTATPSDVSPHARRDRQRHYAFPPLPANYPAQIDLGESVYHLSSAEAQTLKHQGVLRGATVEMSDSATTNSVPYQCHRCHHQWQPTTAGKISQPETCPKCNATDWSEYLLLRCLHCRAVFESEQIRYEVGSYTYGGGDLCPPYELFPLCPYCGAANWCPAEDARVAVLRSRAARRAFLLRLLLLSAAVVIVLIVGAITLGIVP